MGKMFAGLKTDGLEQAEDTVGGGGFQAFESGTYAAKIKMAYATESSGGAKAIAFIFDIDGTEFSQTIYFTKRTGEVYYEDKNDKNRKIPLPGFKVVNDICLLVTNETLAEQETEERIVKIYNFDERKEVNTEVPCLVSLLEGEVELGLIQQIVDKQKKNSSTGKYENTGETRTQNEISVVFHSVSGMTVNEYIHDVEEAVFRETWKTKWDGETQNKASGAASSGGGTTGSGRPGGDAAAAAGGSKPRPGLFAKKNS